MPPFMIRLLSAALCLVISASLPRAAVTSLSEGFEDGTLPTGWTQEYLNGSTAWTYVDGGDDSHPAAAHTGSLNALLVGSNVTTVLYTPFLDFSGTAYAELTFWHAQEEWMGCQDELKVYYQCHPDSGWTVIAHYTESTPDWTERIIHLADPSDSSQVAFMGIGHYGYGICLDDMDIRAYAAPTVTSATADTATDDQAFAYIATATAISGTPVMTFSGYPSWLQVHGDTVSGTPRDPIRDTVFTVTATVRDLSSSQQVALHVVDVQEPPVITSRQNPVAVEEDTFVYIATATDPEGEEITFTVQGQPGWLTRTGDTLRGVPATGTPDTLFTLTAATPTGADTLVVGVGVTTRGSVTSLSEGFDAGNLPSGWTQQYITDSKDWLYEADTVNGGYYAKLIGGDGHTTRLITPKLDFSGADYGELVFMHLQEPNGPMTSSLKVYYRYHDNDSWRLLADYYYLMSAWTQRTLTLPDPTAAYQLCFEGITTYVSAVCIDDINVTLYSRPTVTSAPADTATDGQPFSYVGSATALHGTPSVSFTGCPSWLSAHGDTISGTPDDPIRDTLFAVVAANGTLTDTAWIQLRVIDVNDAPPVITSPLAETACVGSLFVYPATGTDDSENPVTFTFLDLPGWLSASGDTVTGTPAYTDPDTCFRAVASDGDMADTQTVTLTMVNLNQPPTVTSYVETVVIAGDTFVYVPAATDPEGDSVTFTYQSTAGWLTVSGQTLRGVPSDGSQDTMFILNAVTDWGVTACTVVVNVVDRGQVTSISEGFESGMIGWGVAAYVGSANWSTALSGYGGNPPAPHSGTKIARYYTSTVGSGGMLFSPEVDLGGAEYAELTFWHAQVPNTGAQDRLYVYYNRYNSDDYRLLAQYDSSVTDWTQRTLTLPNITADYQILFLGWSEGGYGVCLDDVTVQGYSTPSITSADRDTAVEDQAYAYVATATTQAGTAVLSFARYPAWLQASGDTLYGTPGAPVADTSFSVIATCGSLADTLEVDLTVTAVNHAPVITVSGPDTLARANEEYRQQVTATDTDPSDTVFLYALLTSPAGMTVDSTGMIAWLPDTGDVGTHGVTLSVADGNGGYDTLAYTLDVRPAVYCEEMVADTGMYRFDGIGVWIHIDSLVGSGFVRARVYADSFPDDLPGDLPVKRFFSLSRDNGITWFHATVTLFYTQAEFESSAVEDEASLYCARYDTVLAAWLPQEGTVDTAGNSVSCATSAFSVWAIGGQNAPLPVVLGGWNARIADGNVVLSWSTLGEEGLLGFNVRRTAPDGQTWEQMNGQLIPGTGTATAPCDYAYVDPDVTAGIWYYRLEMVDKDGSIALSAPVTVTCPATEIRGMRMDDREYFGLAVPGPGTGLRAVFSPAGQDPVTVSVFRTDGDLIYRTVFTGSHDLRIDDVPPGIYLMEVRDTERKAVVRLMAVRR